MSFVFPAHAGPEKAVRVLADANSTAAAAMSRRRTAAAGVARVLLVCCTIVLTLPLIRNGNFHHPISKKTVLAPGSSTSKARRAWTDRGTCVPLPFHVTGGQPTVGQVVVAHGWQ
ncbi:unnamed protein product [Spirodela intermedia]|uniref:Uncharacterized protein n=1 Tax=Spirodela intermedia TaxID=51605 RepID=A0ABN7E9I8_SPIIN|nr:unnamed protein product [Spirodela intermedia]